MVADMLTTVWFFIIGFCIIMYVLLDGFDLGIGILFPFFPDKHDRSVMMSTILPVWDGNQTWLVLGGASLYGAFPLAFSLLLPALYLPIFIMVLALLFRGITFEFRLKAKRSLRVWDMLFFLSSTIATFSQGLVLGTFVKGYTQSSGSELLNYEILTPFNIACGISLIFGYVLLGSAWTIGKTTGPLQEKMYRVAKISLAMVALSMMIVSLWTPFIDANIRNIWFNPHYMYKLAVLPIITGVLILYYAHSLYKKYEYRLFWLTIGIFLCGYAGFGISTWPYLIPRVLTVWDAAAPPSSQLFMLVGALLLLPLLVGYTSYSYYIFRGKIKDIIGYE
jgi:cytochrome d ubiquinol oxidase subunit II